MRFFPYLTEAFYSPLPPAQLLAQLAGSRAAADFEGTIAADSFAIRCVISYRNSTLPRIGGWVSAGPAGGSYLRLQHELHPAVLAFATVWLLLVGSVALGVFQAVCSGNVGANLRQLDWPDGIPLGMLAADILLFTLPFWLEVRQSRPRLLALLQLQPRPA